MGNFKKLLAAGYMSAMLAGILTGCGSKEAETLLSDAAETEYVSPETKETENVDTDRTAGTDSETENPGSESQQPETEFICGTVEEIRNDSFTFQRRMIDYGEIIDLENMETELITVKCTADTKYEHWTIRGGGADIDMADAAFSDITEDAGMEIEGYYEGDVFVAVRVVLEVYE